MGEAGDGEEAAEVCDFDSEEMDLPTDGEGKSGGLGFLDFVDFLIRFAVVSFCICLSDFLPGRLLRPAPARQGQPTCGEAGRQPALWQHLLQDPPGRNCPPGGRGELLQGPRRRLGHKFQRVSDKAAHSGSRELPGPHPPGGALAPVAVPRTESTWRSAWRGRPRAWC